MIAIFMILLTLRKYFKQICVVYNSVVVLFISGQSHKHQRVSLLFADCNVPGERLMFPKYLLARKLYAVPACRICSASMYKAYI